MVIRTTLPITTPTISPVMLDPPEEEEGFPATVPLVVLYCEVDVGVVEADEGAEGAGMDVIDATVLIVVVEVREVEMGVIVVVVVGDDVVVGELVALLIAVVERLKMSGYYYYCPVLM